MKRYKLASGTIFLNVVDPLLDHIACAKTTKDAWNNLCATFLKKPCWQQIVTTSKVL
jgi:hypothetical protein